MSASGGRWLDTGDGPARLDPPIGRGLESPVVAAWRTYLDHRDGCEDCPTSALGCLRAQQLWTEYTGARSTAWRPG